MSCGSGIAASVAEAHGSSAEKRVEVVLYTRGLTYPEGRASARLPCLLPDAVKKRPGRAEARPSEGD